MVKLAWFLIALTATSAVAAPPYTAARNAFGAPDLEGV